MKIAVNEIPEQGSEIKMKESVEGLNLIGEEITLKEPVTLKLNINKTGTKVLIKGIIQTLVELECSRCLEDFLCHIDESFTVTFLPYFERPKDPDLELDTEDLDISFYDGQLIDLTELVREQIILSVPMNPICKVNCRGLCPECGKNLNEGRCTCSSIRGEMRWPKLKNSKNE